MGRGEGVGGLFPQRILSLCPADPTSRWRDTMLWWLWRARFWGGHSADPGANLSTAEKLVCMYGGMVAKVFMFVHKLKMLAGGGFLCLWISVLVGCDI